MHATGSALAYIYICKMAHRADYTRCIHVGTIGAFLYIPPSARLLYANWEISITLHNGIYQFAVSCIEAIYKSAPYLLAFYASVGLAAAGTVFSLQQFAYMSLERDLSSPSDGAGCLPTDVIRLLVEVMMNEQYCAHMEHFEGFAYFLFCVPIRFYSKTETCLDLSEIYCEPHTVTALKNYNNNKISILLINNDTKIG